MCSQRAHSQMPKGKSAAKSTGQGPPFWAEVPHPVWSYWFRCVAAQFTAPTGHGLAVVFTRGWLMHAHGCCGAGDLAAEGDWGPATLTCSCGKGKCMSCDKKMLVSLENTRNLLLIRSLINVYSTGVRQQP